MQLVEESRIVQKLSYGIWVKYWGELFGAGFKTGVCGLPEASEIKPQG